jgi:hypothetical protein
MSRLIGNNRPGGMLLLLVPALLLAAAPAFGGQDYVTQFDAYAGYAFLNSPALGLFQNGFATQFGFRPKTWLSAGFDYSITTGDGTVTPSLLPSALQQQLGTELGQLAALGQIPPGFSLVEPIHSRAQTFAAGPQISFRHFTHQTIFWRPVFAGAIYERAIPQPTNPIAAAVAAQLVPTGVKTDTTWFVGVGGGIDVLLTKHFAIRTQVDVIYNHLFPDLLANGYWTVRFSTGPAFNFGKNIKKVE